MVRVSVATQPAPCPYPGRGLIAGTLDEDRPFALYFVTGRSQASRGRHLEMYTDRVLVAANSEDSDDPLRHYTCLRASEDLTVVGNGSHVDEMFGALRSGSDFYMALSEHSFEPDAPIFTPRIAAAISTTRSGRVTSVGSVVRGPFGSEVRSCMSVGAMPPGSGLAVFTYQSDGETIETDGQPRWAYSHGSLELVAESLWNQLDARFRVALIATHIPLDESYVHLH